MERPEFPAAFYVLKRTGLDQAVVDGHVDVTEQSIDFRGLLAARDWSTTEEQVIRAAQSLWRGDASCGIGEVAGGRLEDEDFRVIVRAMAMRRGLQVEFFDGR